MSLKLGLRNKIRRSRSAGAGFTGLLDQSFATGATAAYSLRKLKSSATKAVRVREDSGNTEVDIGFSGGTLDETALLNHVGSNNGFVTKWYDQSGNGNNASNLTASEQPQIVKSGSVIKENGQPAIQFDGSDDYLSTNSFNGSGQPHTLFTVASSNDLSNADGYLVRAGGNTFVLFQRDAEFQIYSGNHIIGPAVDLKKHIFTVIFNSPNSKFFIDNSLVASGDTGTRGDLQEIYIGDRGAGGRSFQGKEQEIIVYETNKSTNRNNIETNINNFYSIF